MSADRWSVCPRCRERVTDENAERDKTVADTYGSASAGEWLEIRETMAKQNAEATARLENDPTLKEYFEIGIDVFKAGDFGVSYKASCTICDFKFDHKVGPVPT